MSARVIIVEGPDGGGKTTLAKKLALLTGGIYVHHGVYPGIERGELRRTYLLSMLESDGDRRPVILDRSWLSETIYGEEIRGASRLTTEDFVGLDEVARGLGAVVILCHPPVDVCESGVRGRAEYVEQIHLRLRIHDRYARLPGMTSLPVVKYDYSRRTFSLEGLTGTLFFELKGETR